MAKKKNRNKDFDSWLESINSNTYIPQMAQNVPNNANYFAGGGPTMGFEYYDDGTGMMRSRMAAPTTDYNIANSPLMDYRTQGFDGTLKMDTLSRKDFDYRNMTPEQQAQFRDYNSNVRQNNRQYRQDVRDTKIADLNTKTDNGEGFLGKMNSNSGANIGGIVGAAAETARVWSDPNSTALDKVGNLLGIANVSKLYTADTEKGDANLNEMTGRLNDFKTNNIQDAWDTLGAGQALKLNKGPNQINLMSNNLGWKDFKRKNMLGLTLGAMGQGAASGGSVGGAWGAAGGAVTGLFAGLGGMFTNKRRAKKAYREYTNKLNYLNNNARMLNAQAQNEWRASNINAINNGVGQEKINDMANFRAYGGNLFDDGGSLTDEQRMVLADIQADPRILFTPKYAEWRDYIRRTSPDYLDRLYTSLPYEQKLDIYKNDRKAWGALSNKAKGDFGETQVRKKTDEVSPYVAGALGLVGALPAMEAIAAFPMLENGLNAYFGYEGIKNLPEAVTNTYDYAKNGDWSRAGLSAGEAVLDGMFIGNGIKGIKSISNTIKPKPIPETMEFYHGGLGSDFDFNNLDVFKLAKKQAKKGKEYAGFYMYDPSLKTGAYKYGKDIGVHKINIDKSAKVLDLGNVERVSRADIEKYKNAGYDMLTGKDVRGYREYVLLNKDAIKSSEFISPEKINLELSTANIQPEVKIRDRYKDNNTYYMPNTKVRNTNTEYALGGSLDMNILSPNMINIQNQSLDNQKYKYMNQMQPLGFINNSKSNIFDGGGKIKTYDDNDIWYRDENGELQVRPHQNTGKYTKEDLKRDAYLSGALDWDDYQRRLRDYENPPSYFNNFKAYNNPFSSANVVDRLINYYFDNKDKQKENEHKSGSSRNYGGGGNSFDFGGSMSGMDLPTGMQSYDAGGTHEENPNGGVQVGVDQQGNPNLVEEGEFRWGDYIFSDRIEVDPDILTNYTGENSSNGKKRGKKGKHQPTYADKAKKYAERNKELANDPIGKNTINDYMDKLSKAEEEQKARDAAQQEYNNALANQTQGNPMYGSMKYNGMGNANAGLNEGNAAMGGMDNSGLSNVNRSGNEMLHAFGGNLYEGGGNIYNMSPRELYATFGTTDLNVIQSMINQSNAVSETPSNPTSGYLYTGNDLPYDIHYSTKVNAITGNPYLNNGTINPRWQEQGNKMLGNKLMPNGAHRDMYRFLDNSAITPGMNNNFNGHGESNYVPRHLEANYQGPFGSTFRETNPFNPDKPQTPPVNNPPVQDIPPAANVPPAKEGPNTNTGGGNSNTGNGGTPPPSTRNGGGTGSGMQSNIDVTGNPGNLNAQYAAGNPWQSVPYQEWTRFGAMAKGLPWVASDAMGHTNWKYKIDNVPPDRMEALGRTGLALRNADHSGMFRAPDLMDVERQNNASQSLLANALRGISNVGGGNRGFVGAQSAAQNYNAQMGIGNNYATTNAYNADQKLKADEFNKQTDQFNANANNQMEADNQRAKQFAKTYEMQGLQNANAERLHERNYKDAVDRAAAADRANNVTNMWDNALEFMQGEAERNHQFNMANSNPINQYYWDKNKRQYIFKNDPNNPMLRMNNVLRSNNMGALSANSQKLLNSYIQQYGNNVPQELLDGLVEIEKQEQQRLAQQKEDDLKAGYRDLENEYDMLLSDYKRRMGMTAEDGKTPKFANYTQDEYQVFDDLRNKPKLDEAGNPIYDEDYYSRLRMRANMMRNMMYGANSYYNVGAYGGKIRTKKKKQHYYMDV